MRKPAWVWVLQVTAALGALPALFALGTFLLMMAKLGFDREVAGYCVLGIALIVCAVLAIVGSERRRGSGRWAGLLLQLAPIVQAGVSGFATLHTPADVDPGPADEHLVDLVVAIVGCVFALVLGWGFGFSRKSRAWFGVGGAESAPP